MTKVNPNDLLWRATRIGVPREIAVPFIHLFCFWAEESGLEWTIKRVKAIKNDFVRDQAGLPMVSVWTSRKGNSYAGVLGGLQRYARKKSGHFRKAMQLLACYTLFKSDRLTPAQWDKEQKAITSPNASRTPLPPMATLLNWRVGRLDTVPLPVFQFAANKRTPGNWDYSWKPQAWSIWPFLETTVGNSYLDNPYVISALRAFEQSIGANRRARPDNLPSEDRFTAGNILLNQERGFKLRLAAAPNLLLQIATYPLKTALYDIIRKDESSAVFDQDKGREKVSEWLAQGEKVYSFDLSSATHRFPLYLQLELLLEMGVDPDMVSLVEKISREDWLLPTNEVIRWEVGQPLGLMPSYGMFHLTHLAMVLSRGISADKVVMLGDDVALCGEDAGGIYERLCDDLGLSISQEKTLSSHKLAEFAGHVVSRDGHFATWKWGRVDDRNFVDQARALPEGIKDFPKKYRQVLGVIAEWPEWYGGLGLNRSGKPLSKRLPPLEYILDGERPAFSVPERPMISMHERNPWLGWAFGKELEEQYEQYWLDTMNEDWGLVDGSVPLPIRGEGLHMQIPDPSLNNQYRHWASALRRYGLAK